MPKYIETTGLILGDVDNLSYTDSTSNLELPAHEGKIRLYVPTDCYITLGGSSATASSTTGTYMSAGTEIIEIAKNDTHIAIVRVTTNATANITGLKNK